MVGCFGWKSAMPRLPRVIEHRLHRVRRRSQPARPLERLAIVVDADAEHLLDFRFVRRAGRQAAVVEQPVAGIDAAPEPAAAATRASRRARIASASAGVTRPEP